MLAALFLAAGFMLIMEVVQAQEGAAAQRWKLTVMETAGIRRFEHPVSARLLVPNKFKIDDLSHFRLSHKSKAVPAQFQMSGWPNASGNGIAVDFGSSHLPFEVHEYMVEYDARKKTPLPVQNGIRVEEKDGAFHIVRPGLTFVVPKDLVGLLRSVKTPKTDYLQLESPGLNFVVKTKGQHYAIEPAKTATVKATVTKKGPLVAALRFEGVAKLLDGKKVPFAVDMEFPRSRSWVHIVASFDDRDEQITALQLWLNLNLQGEPVLVDFGAGTLVYAKIRKKEFALMSAGSLTVEMNTPPTWKTFLGSPSPPTPQLEPKLTPLVFAPPGKEVPPAEGWAHFMDRERCTAVAVNGFAGARQQCDISVSASGLLHVAKTFPPRNAPPAKLLSVWLHFVDMPVQVGAATSPQSMMSPPVVDVSR
jgi:hypothetical protein